MYQWYQYIKQSGWKNLRKRTAYLHKLGSSLGGISKQLQIPKSSKTKVILMFHNFTKVWKNSQKVTVCWK